MSVQVSTRIDPVTKQRFDSICESIGSSPSNVLSMLITGVINHNGIPFNLVAPRVDESPTMKALNDLSKAFEGTAEELGLKTDQDVVDMIKQMRRERQIKQNESND